VAAIAWAGPALEDLRHIHQFIARDSTQYAGIMVRRIRTAVSRLSNFPQSGCVVPEFPDGPYREILVGQYRVILSHHAQAGNQRHPSRLDLARALV
jgi:toxin ParE1/3/4